MYLRLIVPVVPLLFLLTGPVCGQEAGSAAEGYTLAREVCAECHAVDDGYLVSPNPDATPFENIANDPAITALALTVWFRSPHPTMPNLILTDREKANAIAYIRSLKGK